MQIGGAEQDRRHIHPLAMRNRACMGPDPVGMGKVMPAIAAHGHLADNVAQFGAQGGKVHRQGIHRLRVRRLMAER